MYYESELYHHGIKGQKWGKQNGPPYPLSRQEEKASKQYKKYATKAVKDAKKKQYKMQLDANMEATGKVGPVTDKKTQEKWQKEYNKILSQTCGEFFANNKNYQKAEALAKEYDMYSWNDVAKENKKVMESYRKGTYYN